MLTQTLTSGITGRKDSRGANNFAGDDGGSVRNDGVCCALLAPSARSIGRKPQAATSYASLFLRWNIEVHLTFYTAVRLKVEQNQLVGVFGEIGIQVNALKGA